MPLNKVQIMQKASRHCGQITGRSPRSAFSLVELLVTLSIIVVLASLIIPSTRYVLAQGYAAKSISNLRQLQMANIAWAADHDGQYAPVHDPALASGGLPNPWLIRQEFAAGYLGTPYPDYTSVGMPKAAKSGFPTAKPMLTQPGLNTIGYNFSDINDYAGASKFGGTKMSLRAAEITNPSRLIAFAEATDWQILYWCRNAWTIQNDNGSGAGGSVAYRYNGKCIAVAYDGHVFMFTISEADEKALWYNSYQ